MEARGQMLHATGITLRETAAGEEIIAEFMVVDLRDVVDLSLIHI